MAVGDAATPACAGRRAALLTRHDKQRLVAPALVAVGLEVVHVDGYDTDRLGTFTREIPRPGTQLDAAREKARIGMALAGLPLGLASEGAFGVDPQLGLVPWNVELLLFVDADTGLQVVGRAEGPACFAHEAVADLVAAEAFARRMRFPGHALVARPDHPDDPRVTKGIDGWPRLREVFETVRAASATGTVVLEVDVRAHVNPTRQAMIRRAADDLAARLACRCPACGRAGFGRGGTRAGLPCAACAEPTMLAAADTWACPGCGHAEERPRAGSADPGCCPSCNP